MPRLLIRGGVVVSPSGRAPRDVLVEDGRIVAVGAHGSLPAGGEAIDAGGLLVLPGLVDAHVHLRDPGLTHKEDFASGTRAAAAGGITTVLVMPHDDPLVSTPDLLREKAEIGRGRAFVDFALLAAVGAANADRVEELADAGAVAVEAWLVDSPAVVGPVAPADLLAILERARRAGTVVGVYCDEPSVAAGATDRPAVGEELGALVACAAARRTGGPLHLRQVSTAAALDAALAARAGGADVTAEVTPHHLVLTEADARGDPALKVLPPLRPAADAAALREAVADGRVDVVATDHAPHAPEEKRAGASGLAGLETMLSVLLDTFGERGPELVARVCAEAPAARFGLRGKGRIAPGYDADLALVDPDASWTVEPERLQTRARSSPFAGRTLRGAVRLTMLRGQVVAADGEPRGAWVRRSR